MKGLLQASCKIAFSKLFFNLFSRLFCEGGNFSPDETVPLRKKLEKTSQRVDNAEGIVMKDLEGMESRRIEMATDFVNKLDEK